MDIKKAAVVIGSFVIIGASAIFAMNGGSVERFRNTFVGNTGGGISTTGSIIRSVFETSGGPGGQLAAVSGSLSLGYTLPYAAKTSAGVYRTSDGVLVRTLWSAENRPAGPNSLTWDGNDDYGAALSGTSADYHVQILYHNVAYTWEGAIGNTTDVAKYGTASEHNGFRNWHSVAFDPQGRGAFAAMGYNEGQQLMIYWDQANPNSTRWPVGHQPDTFSSMVDVATDGNYVYWAQGGAHYRDWGKQEKNFVTVTSVSDAVYQKTNSSLPNQTSETSPRTTLKLPHTTFQNSSGYPDQMWNVLDFSFNDWCDGPNSWPCPDGERDGIIFDRISSVAVQITGNLLFSAHSDTGVIKKFNKATAEALGSFSVSSPKDMAINPLNDDQLWVVSGNTVKLYTNLGATNPTLSRTISGFSDPIAVAVSPVTGYVVVADGGTSQQLKAYDTGGTSRWTYGTAGGYNSTNGSLVTPDKFMMEGKTFIAFEPDGDLWVGDNGNYRAIKYSHSNTDGIVYDSTDTKNLVAYVPGASNYMMSVDTGDSSRVFSGWREFQVDWTRPFNQSWKLLRNYTKLVPAIGTPNPLTPGFREVATLPENTGNPTGPKRTFAEVLYKDITGNPNPGSYIFEILPNSVRKTNAPYIILGGGSGAGETLGKRWYSQDGSYRNVTKSGSTQTVSIQRYLGVDANKNPIFSSPTTLESYPANTYDPAEGNDYPEMSMLPYAPSVTASSTYQGGIVLHSNEDAVQEIDGVKSIRNDQLSPNQYHLGVVKGGKWMWKALRTGSWHVFGRTLTATPREDVYHLWGNTEANPLTSGRAVVGGHNIIINYYGEFFRPATSDNNFQGQAGQYIHYYDNGLFVGRFGTPNNVSDKFFKPKGASGNAHYQHIVEANGETFLLHSDESAHSGIHVWNIEGANNIGVLKVPFVGVANPSLTFSATPGTITSGQSSTLSWTAVNTSGGTPCTASGGWSGTKAASGSQAVSPTVTTVYTLTCTGASGTTPVTQTLTVVVGGAPNVPPTVSITSPANNDNFTAPATISIAANAADSDGSVTKVEFYNGTTKLGQDTTSPYTFSWTSVPAGTYALTAKAVDNTPATTTSATVNVSVSNPGSQPEPIKLHTTNPRYMSYLGNPIIPIASAEHYGAVMNLQFDYITYLNEMQAKNQTLTRVFSGVFREVRGESGINTDDNTLAPAPNQYIAPWARSGTCCYADGGNKFDLNQWDPAYFARLKDFVSQAAARGIIVEYVLFGAIYSDSQWNMMPMKSSNNINGVGNSAGRAAFFNSTGDLVPFQQAFVQKVALELKDHPNVYYEIANEPYHPAIGTNTSAWQVLMRNALVSAESGFTYKHLIAENPGEGAFAITNPSPAVSVYNFHYTDPTAVDLNYGLNRVISFDETGFLGSSDSVYRKQAWNFIIGGGGAFDSLDWSFTINDERGLTQKSTHLGGGSPTLRTQLGILESFIHSFNFINMAPNDALVTGAPGSRQVLAQPGAQYAIYLDGGSQANIQVSMPAGTYRADWVNTKTGATDATQTFTHTGGNRSLSSPTYSEDIALRIVSTVAPNIPPTVSITSPANNANFTAPATISIAANAADSDGSISKVEFYNGATKLGEDITSPYTFSWTSVPVGAYALTAKAIDDDLAVTTSTTTNVTVTGAAATGDLKIYRVNQSGVSVPGADVVVDNGATITTNPVLLTNLSASDYTVNPPVVNSHAMKVKYVPGYSVIRNNCQYPRGGTECAFNPNLGTKISCSDGWCSDWIGLQKDYVTRVNFVYKSGAPIITMSASPSVVSSGGSTVLSWSATNTSGATPCLASDGWSGYRAASSSETVTGITSNRVFKLTCSGPGGTGNASTIVQVSNQTNQPPTVVFRYTGPSGTILRGDTIPFRADATDSDGSISKVKFYVDNAYKAEDTTSPYTFDWYLDSPGSHTIYAMVYDNLNETAQSNIITGNVTTLRESDPIIALNPSGSQPAPATYTIDLKNDYWAIDPLETNLTINKIEFLRNGVKIGEKVGYPYGDYTDTNVPAGTHSYMARAYYQVDGSPEEYADSYPVSATVTGAAPMVAGLKGEYWNGVGFTGSPLVTRIDPNVDFNWNFTSPAPGTINADQFSTRWTGKLIPQFSETYTIYGTSDDGMRIWVDGALVVDRWTDSTATAQGNVALTAGQEHDIKVEYYERFGGQMAKVEWSSPSRQRQTIPSTALKTASLAKGPSKNLLALVFESSNMNTIALSAAALALIGIALVLIFKKERIR